MTGRRMDVAIWRRNDVAASPERVHARLREAGALLAAEIDRMAP